MPVLSGSFGPPSPSTFLSEQIICLNVLPKPMTPFTLLGMSTLMFDFQLPNRFGSSPSSSGYHQPCMAWHTPSLMVGTTWARWRTAP